MTKYKFRIVGAPPEEAIKEIEIDDDLTVGEVKELIQEKLKIPAGAPEIKLIIGNNNYITKESRKEENE